MGSTKSQYKIQNTQALFSKTQPHFSHPSLFFAALPSSLRSISPFRKSSLARDKVKVGPTLVGRTHALYFTFTYFWREKDAEQASTTILLGGGCYAAAAAAANSLSRGERNDSEAGGKWNRVRRRRSPARPTQQTPFFWSKERVEAEQRW